MNVKQTTDEPKVLPQDTLEGVDEDEWVGDRAEACTWYTEANHTSG